jgi:peptide/nickel transport system substrate-binding protein
MPPFNEASEYGYTYQPDKARKLLEEAGFPNGKGLPEIEISTTGDYVDLIEFIQHNLSEIGVRCKVNVLQSGAHREMVAKSQLELFRKSWFADYADAENFLALFYSKNFCPNGPNYTHYSSTRFDGLFEESLSTIDLEERLEMYRQMDSLVMSASPVIPLYYDQVSHFVRSEVSGLNSNPVNMIDLSRVRKTSLH